MLKNSKNKAIKDITGIRFTRLVATDYHSSRGKERRAFWIFKCDCGNIKILNRLQVEKGKTKSCGCLKLERRILTMEKQIYYRYKKGAKERNKIFELTFSYFVELINKNCTYCGSIPCNKYINSFTGKDLIYSGIDRINSDLGYTIENSVPSCIRCNAAKSDSTILEFKVYIERLKKHECPLF